MRITQISASFSENKVNSKKLFATAISRKMHLRALLVALKYSNCNDQHYICTKQVKVLNDSICPFTIFALSFLSWLNANIEN